jgi:hypothetical protein
LFLGSTIEVLGRAGWTYDDPAQIYAADAATVAEQSKAREAVLGPEYPSAVFELGILYGYLSHWLGGYGAQPEATMRELERPVEHGIRRLNALAAAHFGQLTQRLENDEGGLATRIEQATSLRLPSPCDRCEVV